MAERFEDLVIWQKARRLVSDCFDCAESEYLRNLWPVKNQLLSASLSIMNNIAEGFERGGNKEFKHFLSQAKASAGEVRSMLYVMLDRGWLTDKQFETLRSQTNEIGAGIHGLIRYLQSSDYEGVNRREDQIKDDFPVWLTPPTPNFKL